ncbi:MAG: hypothetical protein JOY95_11500 [Silvibacterium sp.]|nr:hypothetical protein [Silvibacterium sp.]
MRMIKGTRRACCVAICCVIAACGIHSTEAGGNPDGIITQETLIWSDEFTGKTAQSAPNPANWTYDTGGGGWGNDELEIYCSYGSDTAPCNPKNPNAYVGNEGYLHIVAREPTLGTYTSA